MMKPININKKDGSKTTSASNTIWDGPDIPCLDLCKGDTIDKVLYDLALKVCKKFEELDPHNDFYNLECLDLEGCETISFQQLIQILIDRSCEQEGDTPPSSNGGNTPAFVSQTVIYAQNELGILEQDFSNNANTPTPLTFTEYTVPSGGVGSYEVMFLYEVLVTNGNQVGVKLQINGVDYQPNITSRLITYVGESNSPTHYVRTPVTFFVSNVNLQQGDVIRMAVWHNTFNTYDVESSIHKGIFKLTKIS